MTDEHTTETEEPENGAEATATEDQSSSSSEDAAASDEAQSVHESEEDK